MSIPDTMITLRPGGSKAGLIDVRSVIQMSPTSMPKLFTAATLMRSLVRSSNRAVDVVGREFVVGGHVVEYGSLSPTITLIVVGYRLTLNTTQYIKGNSY
jgi:hypothetical protein